ncbi:MAG: YbdD/YjiX family protein [Gemmatimonadales bacterium]
MTERLVVGLTSIARALRAVLGVPDYERYLSHVSCAHPGHVPMTCEQFMEERMQNRYSKPGAKCC